MSFYDVNTTNALSAQFDSALIAALDPRDYMDFGVMDSRVYAEKLLRLFDDNNVSQEARTMVVVLATAVKNRKRIIKAMTKFSTALWYNDVRSFFMSNTCQYTYEEEDTTFSVVHIPSSVPFLAARCWLQMTMNPTVQDFLENLWAAQIYLNDDLMGRQKIWERGFWTHTVMKGGRDFERGAFNEDYWGTKAADRYFLLDNDLTAWGPAVVKNFTRGYSEEEIEDWISTKVFPHQPIPQDPLQLQPPAGNIPPNNMAQAAQPDDEEDAPGLELFDDAPEGSNDDEDEDEEENQEEEEPAAE
jgi:hypothetical protein